MQSREGMPLGKARCWASHEARCLAQRRMAVGPSHPQRMPQTAMTVISTKRCLRLRVCRGSESDSTYEPMELTSTSLATGVILGSVDDGFRAANQGVRQPEDNDRIKDSEPRSVAPDYPDRTAMRAGRGRSAWRALPPHNSAATSARNERRWYPVSRLAPERIKASRRSTGSPMRVALPDRETVID